MSAKQRRIKRQPKWERKPHKNLNKLMRKIYPNLREVTLLPFVNTKIDLSTEPYEEVDNFWEMYRLRFPKELK